MTERRECHDHLGKAGFWTRVHGRCQDEDVHESGSDHEGQMGYDYGSQVQDNCVRQRTRDPLVAPIPSRDVYTLAGCFAIG